MGAGLFLISTRCFWRAETFFRRGPRNQVLLGCQTSRTRELLISGGERKIIGTIIKDWLSLLVRWRSTQMVPRHVGLLSRVSAAVGSNCDKFMFGSISFWFSLHFDVAGKIINIRGILPLPWSLILSDPNNFSVYEPYITILFHQHKCNTGLIRSGLDQKTR